MLALFETLFDIIRLKKGPDAIPYSWALCLIAMTLWLASGLVATILTDGMTDQHFLVGTFTGVVALACYAGILVTDGRIPRLLQTMTAILGCGAVINFLLIAADVFLSAFLGARISGLAALLLLLWSIVVKGHIISRAIDRKLLAGIVAATAVFALQLYLYLLLKPAAAVTA